MVNTNQAAVQRSEHRAWVEISRSALRHNCAVAQKSGGGEDARVMAVIKANAYGHGAVEVAGALAGAVFAFAVANVSEAEELRAAGVGERIFLLGPALPSERFRVVAGGFAPVISSVAEALAYDALSGQLGVRLPVQLVIDTGMGRIGFLPEEAIAAAAQLGGLANLHVESISSHHPSADEDADFTLEQAARFREVVSRLVEAGLRPDFVHIANSAGLLGYPHEPRDVLRAGLMLYGASPLPEEQHRLRAALTWKTRVTLVRELPAGATISYGRTFITSKATRVATLAVGYGDGYPRHLSNRGAEVLIHGRRCPLLGRVTMDQIMVDVSDVPSAVVPGDEAVLLGAQGDETISANELAEKVGTIPWEIFTGISRRVARVYLPD